MSPNASAEKESNKTYFVFDSNRLGSADTATLYAILLLGVLANAFLIVLETKVWVRRRRLSQPRLLIFLLALIDAVSCIFGILPRLLVLNRTPCLTSTLIDTYMLTRFILGSFSILSKLTVVLMGIERFISIRAPFFYVRHCTVKMFSTVQVILVMYSLIIGTVLVFIDKKLFKAVLENIPDLESLTCHRLFLIFEFDIYPERTLIQWQFSAVVNGFTVFQLLQDFLLIIILFVCNTSVISGLEAMERRLRESCPRPTDERSSAQDLMAATGREFSRLMIAINIIVVILTTPLMVCTDIY